LLILVSFLVFTVGGALASYYGAFSTALQRNAVQEAGRPREEISASDIHLRLLITNRHIDELDWPKVPKELHCNGSLGEAFVSFELVLVDEHDRQRAGRGGGGKSLVRYNARNLTLGNFQRYRYLDSMDGAIFQFQIPKQKIEFQEGYWSYYVDLYVKGRHFSGKVSEKGLATVKLQL